MIAGKVWGTTENIFLNHNFEFHRIEVKKGGSLKYAVGGSVKPAWMRNR